MAHSYSFCPSCGAAQGETDPSQPSDLRCPACEHEMELWPLDPALSGTGYRGDDPQIHGCRECGGAWVDRQTLNRIIAEARAQATNRDPAAVPRRPMAIEDVIVYRRCPTCNERMNRRNFGRYSGVIVDDCYRCGTFFDADELAGVVTFVRGGGLAVAELRDAQEARRDLEHRKRMSHVPSSSAAESRSLSLAGEPSSSMFELEVELMVAFFRWVGRWVRRLRNSGSR